MLATGVLCKEFITWTREGRRAHIFNPSAVALFIFSIGLIVTHSTQLSWGEEIAVSFQRPPHIYLEIFLLGLVVQALFSVTLVTLSAAATLYAMNLVFTHSTGLYYFIDTNIPAAVFLGLHLLVTDPATSPRKSFGKIVFGSMYGAGVFGLYWLLGWLGAPTFYDKLLCVPPLNLTVRMLDRASVALAARVRMPVWTPRLRQLCPHGSLGEPVRGHVCHWIHRENHSGCRSGILAQRLFAGSWKRLPDMGSEDGNIVCPWFGARHASQRAWR